MTDVVTIGGRQFRIGATYRPKPKDGVTSHRLKTLLLYRAGTYWPHSGPSVKWRNKNGTEEWSHASAWLKWAGEEVTE